MRRLLKKDCEGCKISNEQKQVKGGIIHIDDYWTLNHYQSEQAFLGWLILQPMEHRMQLKKLKNEEQALLGIHIVKIDKEICNYWSRQFIDDPIERVYVAHFHEGFFDNPMEKYHLHFHLIPRPKSFGKLLKGTNGINAWNIYKLKKLRKFPSKYKVNLNEDNPVSELSVTDLMNFLRTKL